MKVNDQLEKLLLDNMKTPHDLFNLVTDMAVNLSKLLVICEQYVPIGNEKGYLQVLKGIEETVNHHLANKTHVH